MNFQYLRPTNQPDCDNLINNFTNKAWVLLYSSDLGSADTSAVVPTTEDAPITVTQLLHGADRRTICTYVQGFLLYPPY